MNALVSLTGPGSPQTMSSREIAELTGKRHDHVMRDGRAMLTELHGEANVPSFGGVYQGGNGEARPCLNLPKRETLILVSGYSVQLRARIIDRWEELERGAAQAGAAIDVRDPRQFAEIAVQLHAYTAELRAKVSELEPKAEAFENLSNPTLGNWTPSYRAMALGVQRKELIADLIAMRWVYRKPGRGDLAGYAEAEHRGLVAHRQHVWTDRSGVEHSSLQVDITPLGRQRLSLHYTSRSGTLMERPAPAALPAPTRLIQ